jgi:hypothetical protein
MRNAPFSLSLALERLDLPSWCAASLPGHHGAVAVGTPCFAGLAPQGLPCACRWREIDASPNWQRGVFDGLAVAYCCLATVALVSGCTSVQKARCICSLQSVSPHQSLVACLQIQIIRIQLRVPEYGWTTQKVFHLLNFLVCGLRSGVFAFRAEVQDLPSTLLQAGLLDLPGVW